ncbi:tRNA 2-selenouridine(34) synthase MnmH [Leptospira sp. GIMC2001]|uniref:tRNA 2-selenouridine(34) synthase MnmH n=1 Tax=Leptospira sp. GIMC2001 TaxID=1513297 RepID=UPI00234A9831|nr:tRNA 2-selenouridine(34) synthase MnmH [Leptospira sp. GIMC2001]WCL49696.1 tRNA 2-selenouridine(34) synthase MnmH [Leptospira sp. GIMC2001]
MNQNVPTIDVRSPSEFKKGHIPGAISLPLFNDDERAIVGTIYKKEGKESAIKKGLEIVGPKLRTLVEKAESIAPFKKLRIYCWRGGMRSGSVAWLLATYGFEVNTLRHGYKSYRNLVLSYFENQFQLYVIGGKTGSGKTFILEELEKLNEQIVNLEFLANHKGSAFGAIGQANQPSNEHFENLLFEKLRTLNINKRIWIEDESSLIGKIHIPNVFWNQKQNAPLFQIEKTHNERIEHLINQYSQFPKEDLIRSLNRLAKKLGGLNLKKAIENLDSDNFAAAAAITLHYYDKSYEHSLSRRMKGKIIPISIPEGNHTKYAKELIERANEYEQN